MTWTLYLVGQALRLACGFGLLVLACLLVAVSTT